MPLPPELIPAGHQRVMDLVQQAGVDISDWANYANGATNPAANPRYCYEWCFIEPLKVVVLNLWFSALLEREGKISQELNYRDLARKFSAEPRAGAWERRAQAMDNALKYAWQETLAVRVIICDGEMRDIAQPGSEPSRVERRALDPIPWAVTEYDGETGRCTVTRGVPPEPFIDQFSIIDDPVHQPTRRKVLVDVIGRSAAVRRAVLRRAGGICEWCKEPGFEMSGGGVFLETHHVVPIADGGPDSVDNVVALCPNHHREAHHGAQAVKMRHELQERLSMARYPQNVTY